MNIYSYFIKKHQADVLTPRSWTINYCKDWKGYNKLDTKLREIVERFIMARRKFDKQFKNSAVKLILEEGYSVKEV
ncbi:transposase, partial [Streptococcus iniae]|uniref:transposase n=1 Tax=Streptococcus iniae TaxID=1346 RepID=UPI00217D14C2